MVMITPIQCLLALLGLGVASECVGKGHQIVAQSRRGRKDTERGLSNMARAAATIPAVQVLSRAGSEASIAADKNKVREYVKDELFARVVFIWTKASLAVDGVLHKDYLRNCRSRIADGALVDVADSDAFPYMNILWKVMVQENSYGEWLAQKRSSRYQAVQDKFESVCLVNCCFSLWCFQQRYTQSCAYSLFLLPMQSCAKVAKRTTRFYHPLRASK
jgi:hypothetical protein